MLGFNASSDFSVFSPYLGQSSEPRVGDELELVVAAGGSELLHTFPVYPPDGVVAVGLDSLFEDYMREHDLSVCDVSVKVGRPGKAPDLIAVPDVVYHPAPLPSPVDDWLRSHFLFDADFIELPLDLQGHFDLQFVAFEGEQLSIEFFPEDGAPSVKNSFPLNSGLQQFSISPKDNTLGQGMALVKCGARRLAVRYVDWPEGSYHLFGFRNSFNAPEVLALRGVAQLSPKVDAQSAVVCGRRRKFDVSDDSEFTLEVKDLPLSRALVARSLLSSHRVWLLRAPMSSLPRDVCSDNNVVIVNSVEGDIKNAPDALCSLKIGFTPAVS